MKKLLLLIPILLLSGCGDTPEVELENMVDVVPLLHDSFGREVSYFDFEGIRCFRWHNGYGSSMQCLKLTNNQ